jgi:hypothetical protein
LISGWILGRAAAPARGRLDAAVAAESAKADFVTL